MALLAVHNDNEFGIGDTVRVTQEIAEGEKTRLQAFEGMVIAIKGRDSGKTFTVRRVGAQKIGIEKIFPLILPSLKSVEVVRSAKGGTRRSKLYYTRNKPTKEVEKIYSRAKKMLEKTKDKPKVKRNKKKLTK